MNKDLTDLLTEFDETGYAPTTLTAEPEKAASEWKKRLIKAIEADNAALRERLDKAVELPVECYSKVWYLNIIPTISLKANTIYEGTLVGYHIVPINGMIYFIAEIRIENEYGVTQLPNAEKDYNKTWFTDRAAAEKRLAELEGEK